MIFDRKRGAENLLVLCQCVCVTIVFWLWFVACYSHPIERDVVYRYLIYYDFVLLGLILGSRHVQPEVAPRSPGFEEVSRRAVGQLRSILFYLLLAVFAASASNVSLPFFAGLFPLLYVVLIATNRFLPRFLRTLVFGPRLRQKVVLIGQKAKARQVKRWLDHNNHLGLEVIGLLSEYAEDEENDPLPTLGKPTDLENLLSSPGLMLVIFTEFSLADGLMAHYTNLCEERGVRLLVVADLDRFFGQPLTVFEDRGMFFLGLREEPLQNPLNRFFKRCFDIVVSLPVVFFVLPLLLLFTWICQRFQSPGPLLFLQPREGMHNNAFTILKLRTMHVASVPTELLPKSKHDPRLYAVGSFLRKSSLDEMTQFWNVLRGDMSVVGPRPHLMSYNDQYRQIFQRAYVRSFVKPGITGLAQVRGYRGTAESSQDVVSRMQSDIEYLENWSFWLDCWLVLRTITLVFIPPKTAL
jgi:exopolysaccharide biosynthesis polyprenyl glycosylphosphotransferase